MDNPEKVDERKNAGKYTDKVDAVCIAIPNDSDDAYEIMLSTDKPVVTCEKKAMSHHFQDLQPDLHRIGFTASVGGGTGLLHYAQAMMRSDSELKAILNGSLNFELHRVSQSDNPLYTLQLAKHKKLVEPQVGGLTDFFNVEAHGDVPMKTAILCGVLGVPLHPNQLQTKPLTQEDVSQIFDENRRYVVSISKSYPPKDSIGGFEYDVGEWIVSAGFRRDSDALYVPNENNAIEIDGNMLQGKGAGPEPTVNAMMRDLEKLLSDS